MSERGKVTLATLQREQAMAEVLKSFVPQLFSDPTLLSGGAPDSGGQDTWMLSNLPADVLIPLIGLQTIADADGREDIATFVQLILRGVKGISGFSTKQGESIALGLGGGIGRKTIKRPGIIGRNVTNRNWRQKAESEGAEIEE